MTIFHQENLFHSLSKSGCFKQDLYYPGRLFQNQIIQQVRYQSPNFFVSILQKGLFGLISVKFQNG